MQVIRVRTRLESEILRLPELKDFVGKDVEIRRVRAESRAIEGLHAQE